jgi:RNA polymerase sigma-70 factor, ECF subfamily
MVETSDSLIKRLQQARDGDSDALGVLLDEFRPYLKLMAQRAMDGRLAGRIDSSDVVQQTYLSAVRKFDEFTGENADALAGWLQLIHERNLIDTARKHLEAEKRAVGREETLIEVEPLADMELTSPSQRLLRGERAVRLAAALAQLPDDQADAVRLRHLDGEPLEKIALKLGRSERAVAGLLYRGMTNLRKMLASSSKETDSHESEI